MWQADARNSARMSFARNIFTDHMQKLLGSKLRVPAVGQFFWEDVSCGGKKTLPAVPKHGTKPEVQLSHKHMKWWSQRTNNIVWRDRNQQVFPWIDIQIGWFVGGMWVSGPSSFWSEAAKMNDHGFHNINPSMEAWPKPTCFWKLGTSERLIQNKLWIWRSAGVILM